MDVDPSPAQQRSSRKHLRSSDDEDDLEWSSDVSGQFDDADEPDVDDYKSPSAKSAKRRRSNDWPLPEEAADYGNNGTRNGRNGNGSLGPNYKASPRASPRGSAASLRNRHKGATNSPRHRLGRQSRFVEETMSDSVSEQPPSHLFREREHEQKAANAGNRGSGIFRFGKAIASAFNPFGGWNKSSPENASKSPQKDALTQAEEAYAQLKMAGYKGTNKGAYMQNQHIEPANADQTWQAIQDKMRYGTPVASPTRQAEPMSPLRSPLSPLRSPSKSSKRSSFHDLRKATSFGIPFVRHSEQPPSDTSVCLDHPSEDSENNGGIRRQKSRKELSRENKLLKKVSNLEDKLDRARQELRHLSGNEARLPAAAPEPEPRTMSIEMDPGSYPRKFVPGALPTLPSERLLDQQAAMSQSPDLAAQITALPSVEGRSISPEEYQGVTKSPKRRSKESRPSSMGKESSSRKRKSTVPEPIDSRKPPQSPPKDSIDNNIHPSEHQHLVDAGLLSPLRQSKWQKFEPGDSPGSVERKRSADRGASMAALNGGSMHRRSPVLQSRKSSSSVHRSPNSKNIRSPPPRMQRGHSVPRSSSTSSIYTTTPILKSDPIVFDFSSPPPPSSEAHRTFYLQPHCRLDPDHSARNSPTKSRPRSRRRHSYDVDIPPVPPLPKELLASAAKVTKPGRKTHNPARDSAPAVLSHQTLSVLNQQPLAKELFPWPEDIF
ncbi:hypothetical protein N7456_010524 [Penicillium angulare]|uniref:Nuclear RNA binding protein n=1 Tax=Penicillium angulare TaxID=116970 RepID=A0A9W9K688_9EURO|nr:hypothetical protein N7456_010524 [Penicillium angulare]